METIPISKVNRKPKTLTSSFDILSVTHHGEVAGVWIPIHWLYKLDELVELLGGLIVV